MSPTCESNPLDNLAMRLIIIVVAVHITSGKARWSTSWSADWEAFVGARLGIILLRGRHAWARRCEGRRRSMRLKRIRVFSMRIDLVARRL